MIQSILFSILRGILAYLLMLVVLRLMGRKAISQMTFFNLGVTISLGTLTATVGMGGSGNTLNASIVLITMSVLGVFTGYLSMKSMSFRKLISSEPIVIIQNGQLIKSNIKKCRITLNELNSLLRQKEIFNLIEVENAIMEINGELSIQKYPQNLSVTPSNMNIKVISKGLQKDLIIDGKILYENLNETNYDLQWLLDQLKKVGINEIKEVFYAAVDSAGNLYATRGI